MKTATVADESLTTQQLFERAVNKTKYFLPLYIFVPFAFWLVFRFNGIEVDWRAYGLGALGWVIALFLRGPLSALVMKMPKQKAQTIVIASSGVFEECLRLVMLLLTGMTFSWSLSLGQGWAAVEVLYVIFTVIIMVTLAPRTDEKAMQAKEMIALQGNLSSSPVWGVVERISASALHIGCTLIVAKYPLSVILLIPLHSSVNLLAVKLMKDSVITMEIIIAVVGAVMLLLGLVLFH